MKRLLLSPILAGLIILALASLAVAQECITWWAYAVDSWAVAPEDESDPTTTLSYADDYVQAEFSLVDVGESAYLEIPVYPSLVTQTVTITQDIYQIGQWDGFNSQHPIQYYARFIHQSESINDGALWTDTNHNQWSYWKEDLTASDTSTPDDPIVRVLLCMVKVSGPLSENNPWQARFRNTEIGYSVCGYAPGAFSCSTVPNADFTTDDTWTRYSPTAVITNSTLTLEAGDVALQNLTGLPQNKTYNAVISVTQVVSGPIDLNVSLGDVARIFEISSPGIYTDTLTTPAYLGAYQYALWNQSSDGVIVLDYTCLALASTGAGGAQYDCIAPTNGVFDTAASWEYYRGAEWVQPSKQVKLPQADKGMVRSEDSYDLPGIGAEEYLLLSFDAVSESDDGGGVSARVGNLSDESIGNFSNYPTWYTFELDLSNLAGSDGHHVSIGNPGDALEGANISDVLADNVCIFVSDRPMQLPYPVDPDAIIPVDLGFNYGSCADIDGIFAYFGVNIQQYRAEYEAGATVWDPIGWVPWLVAAFWVILATYACFFMGAFVTLVNILEYIINNGLNIGNWFTRMWPASLDWANLWLWWSGLSLTNLSDAYGQFLATWATWIGNALVLYTGKIGVTLAAASDWLGQSLTNIWNWLATYLFNLNGLRIIANWLIEGWNAFLVALGVALSAILDDLAWLWNSGLGPALQTILNTLWALSPLQLPYTVINLLFSLLGLIWAAAVYIWTDGLSVAHTPLTFYNAFDSSLNSAAYDPLAGCVGDNFWCVFLAGIQIINQTVSHSIFYPIIITGIILSTIVILWQNLTELFHIEISLTGFK